MGDVMSEMGDRHIEEEIGAYLSGGLSADERRAFEAHVAGGEACAKALAEGREVEEKMIAVFGDARPGVGFEDRVIQKLRGVRVRRRLVLHPIVWRTAASVAAAVVLAGTGVVVSNALGDGKSLFGIVGMLEGRNRNVAKEVQVTSSNDSISMLKATPEASAARREAAASKAQELVQEAQTAERANNFERAVTLYSQAAEYDPGNAAATQGRDHTLVLMGRNPVANTTDQSNGDVKSRQGEIRYQIQSNLDQARSAIKQQNWGAAQVAIDRARLATSLDPTIFPSQDIRQFRNQIDQADLDLRQSQAVSQQNRDTNTATDIQKKIEEERTRASEERQGTVAELIKTSRNLHDQGKHKEALQTVEQILTLDPSNDYAKGVKPFFEDKVEFGNKRLFGEQLGRPALDQKSAPEELIPYNDILRYPSDWPSISGKNAAQGLVTDKKIELKEAPSQQGQGNRGRAGENERLSRELRRGNDGNGIVEGLAYQKVDEMRRDLRDSTVDKVMHGDKDGDGIADAGIFTFKPTDQLKLDIKAGNKPLVQLTDEAAKGKEAAVAGAENAQSANNSFSMVAKTQDLAPVVWQTPNGGGPADPYALGSGAGNGSSTQPSNVRKVIRNGTMQFEVDRFDDALMRVTKLVVEQGGYVGTTDSDKLPNGKMKGTVTLRVPPERLDGLVMMLRGIGDLKSQKIGAEDVTKHYTDLESQLRAARAMQDRLLEIIKTGKGQIKDLLEAEKQLGVWREKIEQIEGEKRYLDNAVSLSTLSVELTERDIRTPATASEVEQVTMSLETEKVDDAYEKARAAIEGAKGRITQSELKQYDAGQFGAMIQATVPPDAAEQVIARLRQLDGRIAHFERQNKRTTKAGEGPITGVTALHREDAVISMQIYNLANIAPRRTTTMVLAVAGVDAAYQKTLDQVREAGGRIVTSQLTRPDAQQQAADLDFQVPTGKAQSIEEALRGLGEAMRSEATENPDTANVTEAKRGFHLRIVTSAAVGARETQDAQLAALDVPVAFNQILAAVNAAGGRVLQSDLKEQDPHDKTATIAFEIPRSSLASLGGAVDKAAQVLMRSVTRSADAENTLDSKVRLTYSLVSAERLAPRQTVTVREEVTDVEKAADDLTNAAITAGGRRLGNGEVSQDRAGHVTAQVIVEVPMDKAPAILDQIERMGHRRGKQVSYDNRVPDGSLVRARIDVTFSNSAAGLGGDESLWDAIRNGLETSGQGLRWSVQMLVIGACFVAPWVLVVWGVWKFARRRKAVVPVAAT